MLRFKSPALIELVTSVPGVFSTILNRDVKVVDAFASAAQAEEGALFRVLASESDGSNQFDLIGYTVLGKDLISRSTRINTGRALLRSGQRLSILVQGNIVGATICLWIIPQPKV